MDARLQLLRRQSDRPPEIKRELLDALERGEIGLVRALSLSTQDLEQLRDRGLAFLDAGHAEKAKAVFELVLMLEGEDPAVALILACCHQQLGDVEAARGFLGCVLAPESGATEELRSAALEWGAGLPPREERV